MGIKDTVRSGNKIIAYIERIFNICLGGGQKILFVQYPAYNSKIINIASKLPTITIIGFVHDLESLRVKNISESNEYKRFNDFDGLIVLTNQMKQWFIKRGYKGRIVTIDMWDYLMKEFSVHDKEFNTIAFAGNLNKSAFIDKLKNLNTSFSLYGKCDEKRKEQIVAKNVRYRGMFLPDELPYKINDGWGLVWDGDSIKCCSGDYGEYLKYNIPHKTALYLASGVPVFVWKEAAISDFIHTKGIGFLIESLDEIDNIISKVSSEEYNEMCYNVKKVRKEIITGEHIKKATLWHLDNIE